MTTDALKYEVIIYWSDEDHAFIAEMPELVVALRMARHRLRRS